jgi:glycosyltransferase involved in cell wall biosynthesis
MKILYLHMTNPDGLHGFSGTVHFSHAALSNEAEVDVLHVDTLFRSLAKLSIFLGMIVKKQVMLENSRVFVGLFAWLIERRVAQRRPDAIVCVASSSMIARYSSSIPIIYCTDATFAAISRLYPAWQNLTARSFADGDAAERGALTGAAHIVVSSQWAKDSVTSDYGIDPDRVTILPFGANLPDRLLPMAKPDRMRPGDGTLNLLYSGLDWTRKRGDLALAVVRELNRLGQKARLHVVGNIPAEAARSETVVHHGLVNKAIAGDVERLAKIYSECDIFILPTKADATPIVLNEACAFGLPCITFDVGGVSSVVQTGVNGMLFAPGTSPAEIAAAVQDLLADPEGLPRLSDSAFDWSRSRGNWRSWAKAVVALAQAHSPLERTAQPSIAPPGQESEGAHA